jgi:hypothetical protein
MAFDRTKVQFSDEELGYIEKADQIYETVKPAIEDGLSINDATLLISLYGLGKDLVVWLINGTKRELGYKLIALGTGLIRDNELLGDDPAPVE